MTDFATIQLITIFWPIWLGWLGLFFVVELTALALRKKYSVVNNDGATLSESVWWLIRGSKWYHRLALMAFATFWLDLSAHFFLGTSLFL